MKHSKQFMLALAIMLIALLVPSFAMADGTTFTFSKASYDIDFTRGLYSVGVNNPYSASEITITNKLTEYHSVKWTSNDESIVTVGDGSYDYPFYDEVNDEWVYEYKFYTSLYPHKPGTAIIFAKENGQLLGQFTVNFKEVHVTEIAFREAEGETDYRVEKNDTKDVRDYLTVKPDNSTYDAYNYPVKWSVDDSSIARVNKYGTLKGLKAGTVKVTATPTDTKVKAVTHEFTVVEQNAPISKLTFSADSLSLATNDYSLDLNEYLTVEPTDYVDSLIWTSSDASIAQVEEGWIRPSKPGEVTIKVRSKKASKVTASMKLNITKEPLKSIAFTEPALTLTDNGIDLSKYITTDPAYYADYLDEFFFTVSDEEVARVAGSFVWPSDSRIAGTATITAASRDDDSIKAELKVKFAPIEYTSVAFKKQSLELNLKNKDEAKAYFTVKPYNADNKDLLTVVSDDDDIVDAYMDADDGYVTLYARGIPGTTKVYIKNTETDKVEAELEVTVKDNPATAVAFTKDAYTVSVGKSVETRIKKTPTSPRYEDIEYVSSDEEVAIASGNTIYGVNPGTAEITVTITNYDGSTVSGKCNVTVTPVEATKVTLPKKSVKIDYTEKDINQYTFKATVYPSNAYVSGVTFETSDTNVAYVESMDDRNNGPYYYGRIVATGVGKCTVKVIVEGAEGTKPVENSITVKVTAKEINLALSETKKTIYLQKGAEAEPFKLEAFNKTTDELVDVKWSSNKKTIAKVDRSGIVTPVKAGTATITATTKDGNKTTEDCTITVKKQKVTKVTLNKTKLSMKVGDTAQLTWTVKPSYAYDKAVKVKSSNSKVVKVDADGNLTALKKGTAKITVTAADGSKKFGTCKVTVK